MTCGSNPGECTKFYLDIAITLLCLNFSHSTILYHTLWYIPSITASINNTKMNLSIKYIFCSTISHNNQFLRNQKWYYKRTPCIPLYLHLGPTPVNFWCNEFPAFFGNTGNYVIAFLNIWLEAGLIEPLKNVTLFETTILPTFARWLLCTYSKATYDFHGFCSYTTIYMPNMQILALVTNR